MNILNTLTHAVQCQWPNSPRWDTIAAFDVDTVANRYARGCKQANPDKHYRVVLLAGVQGRAKGAYGQPVTL